MRTAILLVTLLVAAGCAAPVPSVGRGEPAAARPTVVASSGAAELSLDIAELI